MTLRTWGLARVEMAVLTWVAMISKAVPSSRCCWLSPTQMIGVRPALRAAAVLRWTLKSVSSMLRRSEWPMMTYSAPASVSMSVLISPV